MPLGRAVNPNIAMVTGFMLDEDSQKAVQKGLEGFKFFGFALAHYYIVGTQTPGRTNIWEAYKKAPPFPEMPTGAIGSPDEVRANLETFEQVGVDQIVFIQQGGKNHHEDICESLDLFATAVMPEFREREAARAARKAEALAPFVEAALTRKERMKELADDEIPAYRAYGLTIDEVTAAIRTQFMSTSGGDVKDGAGDTGRRSSIRIDSRAGLGADGTQALDRLGAMPVTGDSS